MRKTSLIGAGFAMALAGLMGTAQAKGATLVTSRNINEVAKTIQERKKAKEEIKINQVGGLDFNTFLFSDSGIPPHIYGMMHIKSSGGKKFGNRLRFSHNAKLKRRRAK